MKSPILAAALISLAASAAAEQPAHSDTAPSAAASSAAAPSATAPSAVEARLDALERINVTAYKAPQANDVEDAEVDAILAKAAQAQQTEKAAE